MNQTTESIAETIEKNARRHAAGKKRADRLARWIFLALAVICASVIVVVLVFIVERGLKPFFHRYRTQLSDGTPFEGTASFSYFFSGTRFSNGFDLTNHHYLYGVGHLIVNSLILNFFTILFAVPTSILTALFISKIAPKPLAVILKSGVDLLAAIPSVIYGVFGMGVVVPLVRSWARAWGMSDASGVSLLSGAIVLTFMIIPTIVSISVTALDGVHKDQMEGSLALGASKTQTNFKICLRAAKSGIFAGIILGVGRALGEATAISMVCGAPIQGITWNPFTPTVTLTSQMLMALGEAIPDSMNYDIRFSAGMVLMIIILITNVTLNDIKDHLSEINPPPFRIVRVGRAIKKGTLWAVSPLRKAWQKRKLAKEENR